MMQPLETWTLNQTVLYLKRTSWHVHSGNSLSKQAYSNINCPHSEYQINNLDRSDHVQSGAWIGLAAHWTINGVLMKVCERVQHKTVNEPTEVCVHVDVCMYVCVCVSVLTEGVHLKACVCPCGGGFRLYLARWAIKMAEVNPSTVNSDWECFQNPLYGSSER